MNKQFINKIIVFIWPVLALLLLVITTNAQSTWTTKANFSCTPRNGAAFFVIGTKAYVGTGEDADSLRSDFWQWDICSNTWTQISDFPGAPRTSGSGFSIGANGYVGLGWDNRVHGTIFYNDIYEYSPSLNTWAAKANFNGGGREQASCININDSIYIGLGYSGFSRNDFWKYDAVNDTWIQRGNFPGSNRRDASSFAINGKGYIGTGYDESTGVVNDFWEYDPTVDHWTEKAQYGGIARHLGVGFAIGNIGYIGLGTGNGGLVNDFWSWNPATDQWTQQTDFGGSPRDVAVGFSVGCRGYVGLGGNYPTPPSAIDFWEFYDPTNPYPCFASPVYAGPDATICSGQSTTLQGTGGNVAGYTWSPAIGLSNTSIANPVASPTVTTPYVLQATGGSGCSISTYADTVTVSVAPTITLGLANDTTVCDGQPVALNPNSSSTPFTYSWAPGTGLSCSTCANPVATPLSSVTYTLTVNNGSCSATDSVRINLGGKTKGGIVTAVRDTICQGTPGNLTLAGNSSDSIQWQGSLNNNTYAGISGATSATYKTPPLQRSTWYRAVVGTGHCMATSDSLQLYVPPALIASFYATHAGGKQVNFNSDSSIGNIRSYHWDFGDGQTSTEKNPSHTFAKDTTYYVCLTLYDGSNCSYTFCRYNSIGDAIPTLDAAGNWVIYPNPFSRQLTISSKQMSATQSIDMYNVLGQLVASKSLAGITNATLQLDVSLLAKGMYFVIVRTATANYVQKVIKQ